MFHLQVHKNPCDTQLDKFYILPSLLPTFNIERVNK